MPVIAFLSDGRVFVFLSHEKRDGVWRKQSERVRESEKEVRERER